MKYKTLEDGKTVEVENIFDKIDRKLTGNKVYDFYYKHIWLNINHFFYQKPKSFFHNIKLFYQRGKKGYTEEDYWALNYHLAEYLAGVLRDWSNKCHSHPTEFTEKEWELFLSLSAEGFEDWLKIETGDDPYRQKEETRQAYELCMKKISRFFMIASKYFDTLWD